MNRLRSLRVLLVMLAAIGGCEGTATEPDAVVAPEYEILGYPRAFAPRDRSLAWSRSVSGVDTTHNARHAGPFDPCDRRGALCRTPVPRAHGLGTIAEDLPTRGRARTVAVASA
jgi:hypothetical protein